MKKYIDSLVIGEKVTNEQFCLKDIGKKTEKEQFVTLSDSSGNILATIPPYITANLNIGDLKNMVLTVTGIVMSSEGRKPLLHVKECSVTTNFNPSDFFCGLSEEKIEEYIRDIEELKKKVSHNGFQKLLDVTLTRENLERLGKLPATLGYYGKYAGGALAATDSVTRMVTSAMASYSIRGNGITTTPPAWNVLVTASLLFRYGCIRFFTSEQPFKKTTVGITMGYASTLQSMVEDAVRVNNISLTERELASLLNILLVSVSDKTEAQAVSKEGTILRSMIRLYGECDSIDCANTSHEKEAGHSDDNCFYSAKLGRYLVPVE